MKIEPIDTKTLFIVFKVWCPKFNRVSNRLFLLGSIQELGAWSINDALEAQPTGDIHIWKVEANIPPMAQFEWVWVTSDLDRTGVEWERAIRRNRTIDCFGGTIHTIWGDGEEVFLQSATCVELTTFMCLDDGYLMVLYGSTPTTGDWNINKAVAAREFPKRSGYWKVQIAFDASTNLQFKWAVVKEKDRSSVRVQENVPHSLQGRRAWLRAVAPWMSPVVIIVDTCVLCDVTDNLLGRTDLIVKQRKKRGDEIRSWLVTTGRSGTLSALGSARPSLRSLNVQDETSPHDAKTAIPLPAPPTHPTVRVPTVKRIQDLDDHIKQRQESLTKIERVTKQLNKDFKDEIPVIKGKGQKQMPQDALNLGEGQKVGEMTVGEPGGFGEVLTKLTAMLWPASEQEGNQTGDGRELHPSNRSPQKNQQQPMGRPPAGDRKMKDWKKKDGEDPQKGLKAKDQRPRDVFSPQGPPEDGPPCSLSKSVPQCVTSQILAHSVQSDTAFTEMTSSYLSSIRADATMSESMATLSHTLTSALAIDPNNMSDVDEGYSESDQLLTEKLEKLQSGTLSFWESQQKDLTPPWLDKKWNFPLEDNTKFLADSLSAVKDDCEHLDWLSSKIDMEDLYCTSKCGLGFQLPPDHPFIGSVYFVLEGALRRTVSDSSLHLAPFVSPNLPKTLAEKAQATESASNTDEATGATSMYSSMLDFSYTRQAHPCDDEFSQSQEKTYVQEDEELAERRRVAKALEERWGDTSRSEEHSDSPDPLSSQYDSEAGLRFSPSIATVMSRCDEFAFSRSERYKMSRYSWTDLSETVIMPSDPTDRRAQARETERLWGESSKSTDPKAGSGDSSHTERPANFRYYKPKV